MDKKFAEYTQFDLSQINKEMLQEWDNNDLFHKSMSIRDGHPSFVFYEGPPSANGMPGIHHVMARTIKDIFCRYKTMKGFLVRRKAGWDTHGLPVELSVEKSLGITKEDIGKRISVEEYNAACRKDVMKYTHEWEDLTHKMGYWVDTEHPYITYDNKYIETLWWLLKHHTTLFTGSRYRTKHTRAEPTRMLQRCERHYLCGTICHQKSETRNEPMGDTGIFGMDDNSVDTSLKHGTLRRAQYRVQCGRKFQPLYL